MLPHPAHPQGESTWIKPSDKGQTVISVGDSTEPSCHGEPTSCCTTARLLTHSGARSESRRPWGGGGQGGSPFWSPTTLPRPLEPSPGTKEARRAPAIVGLPLSGVDVRQGPDVAGRWGLGVLTRDNPAPEQCAHSSSRTYKRDPSITGSVTRSLYRKGNFHKGPDGKLL